MATWADVRSYIHANYRVEADKGGFITMVFHSDDGRSQLVFVKPTQNAGGDDFVIIESPVGKLGQVNLVVLLRQVERIVCGGLSLVGDTVTLRHAVPLDDMSVDEFELPLHGVCSSADELEKSVSFQDAY